MDIHFTPRERELLELLRLGLPNKIIAHEMGVTQSTVKSHLHSIMTKLRCSNRTQVVCLITHSVDATR